jgi:Ca-activated chloride channel family protein
MGIGADFDERLMTQLATAGAGAFYYLAKLTVLPRFFDAELQTASTTIASGAKLTLYTGSGVSVVDAMGLETQVLGNRTEIAVGSLYAGQERTIWLTLKVPSRDLGTVNLGELSLEYRVGTGASQSLTEALPRLACVAEWEEFRRLVKKSVWERAVVEEELSRAQERLGDAIASGSNADVEREVTSANQHRKLAQSLGSKKVEQAIVQLESSAASAKLAQQYAPAARNSAAKSQKSTGYMMRNSAKYINVDPFVGF